MLEYTLFGMRNKILDHQDRPAELQKLRKQQRMIEKELIRVKRLLSTSAKVKYFFAVILFMSTNIFLQSYTGSKIEVFLKSKLKKLLSKN